MKTHGKSNTKLYRVCIAMIVCNDCGMLLSNKYNKKETKKFMIEAWNRRVDDGREEKG